MNPLFKKLLIICLSLGLFTECDTTPEAVEDAQEMNEEKITSEQLTKDADYLTSVAYDLMLSNRMAEIAQTRATDPRVVDLAGTIIEDHNDILDKLKSTAAQLNIVLPNNVDDEANDEIEDLEETEVEEFDEDYLEWVIAHHEAFKDGVNEVISNTNRTESILNLANLISTQNFAHKSIASDLKPKLAEK